MDGRTAQPRSKPAFEECAQCGYSLEGLPANHFCPECGLRFDERCELYRFPIPKKMHVIFAVGIVGGCLQLLLLGKGAGSGAQLAVLGLLFLWWLPFAGWFLYRLYRRGQQVAVTTEGLLVRMFRRGDGFIPWNEITGATVKREPLTGHQLAIVSRRAEWERLCFGGVFHPFPTRDHVERFVRQVNERVRAAQPSAPYVPGNHLRR